MSAQHDPDPAFGANSWLVDEMYSDYLVDSGSVSESWQEFFSDYRTTPSNGTSQTATLPAPAPILAPTPAPMAAPSEDSLATVDPGDVLRGAGAAIAGNMQRSLSVPTATSFRNIPAKLLEVNRKVINGYRTRAGRSKVSFTHIIGYAIVRAIADAVPQMNNSFLDGSDGKPRIVRNRTVSMARVPGCGVTNRRKRWVDGKRLLR